MANPHLPLYLMVVKYVLAQPTIVAKQLSAAFHTKDAQALRWLRDMESAQLVVRIPTKRKNGLAWQPKYRLVEVPAPQLGAERLLSQVLPPNNVPN